MLVGVFFLFFFYFKFHLHTLSTDMIVVSISLSYFWKENVFPKILGYVFNE